MTKRAITFEEAKSRYIHRFTMEFVPIWAFGPRDDGTYYAPQYNSDLEWYENTLFPGEGHVGRREKHCFSSGQTWPLGRKLANQYIILPCSLQVARKITDN